ncbi:phosphatidylglycerophosphatase A family protein [Oleidesulfovibrio alaskensis]|jgi:phosphatidylglycerophosphatase A|uniref:phosphatidylglycerophosphatase A family protein n=1 Tax=Oleidesulfovibrio alaskensis TaxID=58180 RepID=UPI0003FBA21F|nr:phosphatidylglycerophosphatase A [Oleidesulfovibrio alaskensis]
MTEQRSFMDRTALFVARGLGAGLFPVAPGTCGTALGALLAPWLFLPLSFPARLVVVILVFMLGCWAADRAEHLLGRKDPGEVVIDEIFGLWLCLLPFAQVSTQGLVWAFVLFRIFDIAKPWPVRQAESWLPGGGGVMIDDGVAGLWAMVVFAAIHGV